MNYLQQSDGIAAARAPRYLLMSVVVACATIVLCTVSYALIIERNTNLVVETVEDRVVLLVI